MSLSQPAGKAAEAPVVLLSEQSMVGVRDVLDDAFHPVYSMSMIDICDGG